MPRNDDSGDAPADMTIFFEGMSPMQQLEVLQQKLHKAAQRRKQSDDDIPINSHLLDVMQLIERTMSSQGRRVPSADATPAAGGVAPQKEKIREDAREMEAKPDALRLWGGRKLMAASFSSKSGEVAEDVLRSARSAHSTASALTKVMSTRQFRQDAQRMVKDVAATVQAARPLMRRSRSFPGASATLHNYEEFRRQLQESQKRTKQLEAANAGLDPRDEEVSLQQRCEKLQEQVVNQLMLIKGLRERIRRSEKQGIQTLGSIAQQQGTLSLQPSLTAVIISVQGGGALFADPSHPLTTQMRVFMSVIQTQLDVHHGTMGMMMGARMACIFSDSLAACRFALDVQVKLTEADWDPALREMPDSAVELCRGSKTHYLWRGLRAKIGISSGVRGTMDPLRGATYEGKYYELAGLLSRMAMGGEILLSSAVADKVQSSGSSLSNPLLESWGELSVHVTQDAVHRLLPRRLADRSGSMQRDILIAERSAEVFQAQTIAPPPPAMGLTLVVLMIADADLLKSSVLPADYTAVLRVVAETIDEMARTFGGYISVEHPSPSERIAAVLAFDDAVAALRFSLELQVALLTLTFPAVVYGVPSYAAVKSHDGTVIFSGPRLQVGVYQPQRELLGYVHPVTTEVEYLSIDAVVATQCALAARGGEVILPQSMMDTVTKRCEELGMPIVEYVSEAPSPIGDTLVRFFRLFPQSMHYRTNFLSRSMRLANEPSHLLDSDLVKLHEEEKLGYQQIIIEKNRTLQRVERMLEAKDEIIGKLRMEVMGLPFYTWNMKKLLGDLDITSQRISNRVSMMAVSFAARDELLADAPAALKSSVPLFTATVGECLARCGGREIRRYPDETVKLLSFPTVVSATTFWVQLNDALLRVSWPPSLDDLDHTATVCVRDVMASLQGPERDVVLWSGLRPIASLVSGIPSDRFNPCARCYEVGGEKVHTAMVLLAAASDGDCVVDASALAELEEQASRLAAVTLLDYGTLHRIVPTGLRMRVRTMRGTLPPIAPTSTKKKTVAVAVAVHVAMQRHTFLADFPAAATTFRKTVAAVVASHKGDVTGQHEGETSIAFVDVDAALGFLLEVHRALMLAPWEAELLRLREFKDLAVGTDACLRGVRAHVAAHIVTDVVVEVDAFTGLPLWSHPQWVVPCLLAGVCMPGETIVTKSLYDRLIVLNREGKTDAFTDYVGVLRVDGHENLLLYQALSSSLRHRLPVLWEEEKMNHNPTLKRQRELAYLREKRRRDSFSATLEQDAVFLGGCERTLNPLEDPIHRKSARLLRIIREQLHHDYAYFKTCEKAMALVETTSMMAEDVVYLGNPDNGLPYHAPLLLYAMERGSLFSSSVFHRKLAVEMLSSDLLSRSTNADAFLGSTKGLEVKRRRQQNSTAEQEPMVWAEDVHQIRVIVDLFEHTICTLGINEAAVKMWVEHQFARHVTAGSSPGSPRFARADRRIKNKPIFEQLRELATRHTPIGLDVEVVDVDLVKDSVAASLSNVFLKLLIDEHVPPDTQRFDEVSSDGQTDV